MSKKAFLWISLFFSFLSLFYFAFSYYGVVRYFSLKTTSIKPLIENYKSLPKADKNRVVLCISATESEMKKIKPTIGSLLDQTVKVDDIILFTRYYNMEKIPKEVKPVLTVNGYSKNYSSSPNILCGLLTEPDANTKLIMVKPDVIYGEEFVEKLVEKSNKNPNSLVETKYGILLKPSLIKKDISEYEEGERCILENNIPAVSVAYNFSYKH